MEDVISRDIVDGIAEIRLNRPDKHNAINRELFQALADVGDEIARDTTVRAVILSGRGENFCAGIDVSMLPEMSPEYIQEGLQPRQGSPANFFQRAAYVWREVPVPVICAIQGVAYGGGLQIALGADLRYAAPSARLSVMEIKWGLIPDMAISATARETVRADVLKELSFSGRIVDGVEAQTLGLVTAVHEDPQAAARKCAEGICQRSPDAIRAMKRLFEASRTVNDDRALALEAELQAGVLGRPNQREAVAANLQKRPPKFTA